jgi:hypothetical protein
MAYSPAALEIPFSFTIVRSLLWGTGILLSLLGLLFLDCTMSLFLELFCLSSHIFIFCHCRWSASTWLGHSCSIRRFLAGTAFVSSLLICTCSLFLRLFICQGFACPDYMVLSSSAGHRQVEMLFDMTSSRDLSHSLALRSLQYTVASPLASLFCPGVISGET